ncbi:MAG: hypothetical protein U0350_22025 [Caldilineaceae bacterium]
MTTTFLQELRGYLGKGFFLAVFIPTMLFGFVHLTLYLEIAWGLLQAWQRWADLPSEAKVILGLVGLSGLAFFAYLIHNFQLLITRFFEGYWQNWPLFRWLQEPRRRRYFREWQYLNESVASLAMSVEQAKKKFAANQPSVDETPLEVELNEVRDRWLTFFPPPNRWQQIRPTRFGNIFRARELYATERYGIDASVIWPRLYPLLQSSIVDALEDKKIAIDFMLLIAVYASLITLIWCPILAVFTDRWLLFLICASGFPLAWLSYQSAVQDALAYGAQIKTIFDLYRHELLKALGFKIPVDPETERQLWEDISFFLHRNIPPGECCQRAIDSNESYQYLTEQILLTDEPKGWKRIGKAKQELWQGIKEVFQNSAGEKTS